MKQNITNSFLALMLVVFVAAGCQNFKSGQARNTAANVPDGNVKVENYNADPTVPNTTMPSSKAIAWNLADKLSMAAILYDLKGAESSDSLSKAKILAREVGATVPSFPVKSGDKSKDTAAILAYLLNDVNKNIGSQVKAKYGQSEAALFEMSLKSNILLLLYAPGDSMGKTVAKVITANAKTAGLPENLWMPTVQKIESGASFDEVKNAILKMQTDVSQHLGKS
ncbi:MAG: hypothetical protein ACR2HG_11225 [Pyrinomonadaceae bacterium]